MPVCSPRRSGADAVFRVRVPPIDHDRLVPSGDGRLGTGPSVRRSTITVAAGSRLDVRSWVVRPAKVRHDHPAADA
jgi:hypothetical protein